MRLTTLNRLSRVLVCVKGLRLIILPLPKRVSQLWVLVLESMHF